MSLAQLRAETGLSVVEVLGQNAGLERLRDLQACFLRHFPEQPHVVDELDLAWRVGSHDPDVIVHGWLLENEEGVAGLLIFHTNLRTRIVLQHYVAIDESARATLPYLWLGPLFDAMLDVAETEAHERGAELLATIGEISPRHVAAWKRIGYRVIDVDYREPVHGKHWAHFGEIEFKSMTVILRCTQFGETLPIGEVAQWGVQTYLIDHYGLPRDNPSVDRSLGLARALRD